MRRPEILSAALHRPMMHQKSLSEFIILDVEPSNVSNGKFQLAEVELARAADFGKNDQTFFVKTHLGNVLRPGDTVLGYDLTTANVSDMNYDR